jgi:mono/diheme cytochrome c family protein
MNRISHFVCAMLLLMAVAACGPESPENAGLGAQGDIAAANKGPDTRTLDERLASGERIYRVHCAACHQASGQGLTGAFPPLAQSDYLEQGPAAVIRVVLQGMRGPVTVNGVDYDGVMPNLSYLGDSEVADVLTYVLNSWGNTQGVIEADEVAANRED